MCLQLTGSAASCMCLVMQYCINCLVGASGLSGLSALAAVYCQASCYRVQLSVTGQASCYWSTQLLLVNPAIAGQPSCYWSIQLLRVTLSQLLRSQVSCYRSPIQLQGRASLQGQHSSRRLGSTTAAAQNLTCKLAVSGATAGCAAAF